MRMRSQPNPNPGKWELAVDPIRGAPRQGELLICNTTPRDCRLWDCSKQSHGYEWRLFITPKGQLSNAGSVAQLGEGLLHETFYLGIT